MQQEKIKEEHLVRAIEGVAHVEREMKEVETAEVIEEVPEIAVAIEEVVVRVVVPVQDEVEKDN